MIRAAGMQMETRDLFEGAYYLSQGAELANVRVERNGAGKPKVTFVFSGDGDLARMERSYRDGSGVCEVNRLRLAMNRLRDLLFDALRDQAR